MVLHLFLNSRVGCVFPKPKHHEFSQGPLYTLQDYIIGVQQAPDLPLVRLRSHLNHVTEITFGGSSAINMCLF